MTPSVSHSDDGPTGRAGPKVVDPAAAMTQPPAPARKRHDWRDWRTWSSSAVIQGLVALAIYTTVWLTTAAKPLLHNVGDAHLFQVSMDPNFYTWCLRWWPWAIAHGQDPLFAHVIRAPVGTSLAWVTTVPPVALLGTPLTLAAGPIAAFNILTAIALPLSAWAAFVLCRRLTRQFWPSLAGGAVFGFSAYEMTHVTALPAQPDLQPAGADSRVSGGPVARAEHRRPHVRDPGRAHDGRAVLPVPRDVRRPDSHPGRGPDPRHRARRSRGPASRTAPHQAPGRRVWDCAGPSRCPTWCTR